jgi:hypothetical protein
MFFFVVPDHDFWCFEAFMAILASFVPLYVTASFSIVPLYVDWTSGGELLEMGLLDSHLLDTFGSKSIARHKFYQLLESS